MKRVGALIVGSLTLALALSFSASAVGAADGQTKGDPVKGKAVYTAQRCSMCHKIGDEGGPMGPALTDVGSKRDAEWLMKFLPNPKGMDSANKMPAAKATGEDLDNLVAYLLTLKAK